MLGTGARGKLREPSARIVSLVNTLSGVIRIAIDIPTGLNCDTGEANDPTFQADHTLTFVAPKIGFVKSDAARYTGVVHEVSIGIPRKLLEELSEG